MNQITLLFGTGNAGKLASMSRRLSHLGIQLIGLKDMEAAGKQIPVVEETGASPLENARIKAKAYYNAFHMPVFSCDTGLYFEDIPEEYQPGIHVRTVHGKYLSDEEMIAYYGGLARQFGSLKARYRNAVCFYLDENHIFESMEDSLSGKSFLLTAKPYSGTRQPGFPLDSLSVQIESGRYYYDLGKNVQDEVAMDDGFCQFFQEALSRRKYTNGNSSDTNVS